MMPIIQSFEFALAGGTSALDVTISKPAGVQPGDLLILLVGCEDNTGSPSFADKAGWDKRFEYGDATPDTKIGCYTRIADGSEPASETVTWTATGADAGGGWYLRVTNHDPAAYWNILGSPVQTAGSTSSTAPSVTTSVADCLVFALHAFDGGDGTRGVNGTGWPSDFPANQVLYDTTGTTAWSGGWVTKELAAPGASGDVNFTSNTSDGMVQVQFAIAGIGAGIAGITPDDFTMIDAFNVSGQAFGASQGASTIYLSDANTLAGSANEVDITAAVTGWSDTLIEVDLSTLDSSVEDALHTLGSGNRYFIVLVGSDEYSVPFYLRRPEAFSMSAGALTEGPTTQRLTGLTGTFAAGSATETENPSPTLVNVPEDGNREDVWSIQSLNTGRTETYEFRVLYNGQPLDTYTVTPQVTVTSGGVVTEVTGTFAAQETGVDTFSAAGSVSGGGGGGSADVYYYLNSLVSHETGAWTQSTRVPNWVGRLATVGGDTYTVDSEFGFVTGWNIPPAASMGFTDATDGPAAGGGWTGASDVEVVSFTPDNFDGVTVDPSAASTIAPSGYVASILTFIDAWETNAANANRRYVIYAGWPDMGPYGDPATIDATGIANWQAWALGGYQSWMESLVSQLQAARPALDIRLHNINQAVVSAYQNTVVSTIPATTLFEDDAPHGRPTWYFLAGLAEYMCLYGEKPPAGYTVPGDVDSVVATNYQTIIDYMWDNFLVPPAPARVTLPGTYSIHRTDLGATASTLALEIRCSWTTAATLMQFMSSDTTTFNRSAGDALAAYTEDLGAGTFVSGGSYATSPLVTLRYEIDPAGGLTGGNSLRILVDGVEVLASTTTGTSVNTGNMYFLADSSGANQFSGEVEYLTLWLNGVEVLDLRGDATVWNAATGATGTVTDVPGTGGGGTAPTNTVAPTISGAVTEGSTLTATTGTWDGNPAPALTYQWRRAGVDIGGATSATYVTVVGDVGSAITCAVTGTNASGSATAVSSNSITVTASGGGGGGGGGGTSRVASTTGSPTVIPDVSFNGETGEVLLFSGNGTFTLTEACTVYPLLQGAGGAGGKGADFTGADGGDAGQFLAPLANAFSATASTYTGVVGVGGVGSDVAGTTGGTGGSTSLTGAGVSLTALGGAGGISQESGFGGDGTAAAGAGFNGGAGTESLITGASVYYGGGGGGSAPLWESSAGLGGIGGGGDAGVSPGRNPGVDGTDGLGGGGGAAGAEAGGTPWKAGDGGDGVLIVFIPYGAAGLPDITGSFSTQETGTDQATFSAAVGPITAALNTQETGADTAQFVLSSVLAASLSAVETGSDILGFSGSSVIAGSFAAQETGTDQTGMSLVSEVSVIFAAQENGNDSATFSGYSEIVAELSAQESGSDDLSLILQSSIVAALAAIEEGSDSLVLTGTVAAPGLTAQFGTQEIGSDSLVLTGSSSVSGTFSTQETGADAIGLVATVAGSDIVAQFQAQESGADSFTGQLSAQIAAALAAQEDGTDRFIGTATLTIAGAFGTREAGSDTAALSAATEMTGALAAQEIGADTLALEGTVSLLDLQAEVVLIETGADTFRLIGRVLSANAGTRRATTAPGSGNSGDLGQTGNAGHLLKTKNSGTLI